MRFSRILPALLVTAAPLPAIAQEAAAARAAQLDAASEARAAGDFGEARGILLAMLAATPEDPDLLRRLAMVEAGAGNLAEAQARIDRAAALAPDDLDIALARAYILYWRGEFAAAQDAVDAITAREPDYPELGTLRDNLARRPRANRIRLRSLAVSASVSDIAFVNRAGQTWTGQGAAIAVDVGRSNTLTFGLEREDRGPVDTQISGRFDRRLGSGFAYLAATAVPAADFREEWSLAAGGEIAATDRIAASIDLRYAEYATGSIVAIQPGLRFDLGRDLALTGRAINLFGGSEGYRLGGSVRFDYRPASGLSAFAIGASYPDAEADGVRQLRSAALGLTLPLADRVALTAATSYDDRENSYRRLSGTLALTYRFGGAS